MKSKLLIGLLLLCFLADQICIYFGLTEFRFFTKLILIPLLLAHYLVFSRSKNWLFILGLIFSFFGDLFLLFKWGFLFGLGSFFLAHLFYIFAFKQFKTTNPKKLILLLGIYLSVLLMVLFPYLKEMKIPVICYGIVISVMLYFAVATKDQKLIIGGLLFVISDTILSLRLFMLENVILDLLVMFTYVLAQYFLVKGMINKKVLH